jgi:CRP-like cAMP-binding protein
MHTSTRAFLREFAAMKARARRGEVVRVKDKEGEFVFTAASTNKSLLGVAKGKIRVLADLTEPTLQPRDWRPSL